MSDEMIRGILYEKKRRAAARKRLIENALISIMFGAFGLYFVFAIASSTP